MCEKSKRLPFTLRLGFAFLVYSAGVRAYDVFDTSFGNQGFASINFGLVSNLRGMTIQGDDKIVAVGYVKDSRYNPVTNKCIVLRFTANGAVDTSFGDEGRVISDFGFVACRFDDVVIQTNDAHIVAVGNASNALVLARYLPNGDLDGNFCGSGMLVTNVSDGWSAGYALAVQDNGSILVAGEFQRQAMLFRYTSNGLADISFGEYGVMNLNVTNGAARDVVIRNNKILTVIHDPSTTGFVMARVLTNGTFDATFGTGGKVNASFNSLSDNPQAMALQADDRIVVVGSCSNASLASGYAILRLTSAGEADNTFGSSGLVKPGRSSLDIAYDVAIQEDGKIAVGGGTHGWTAVRVNSDGSYDRSFGQGNGIAVFTGDTGVDDCISKTYAMALQHTNAILLGGYVQYWIDSLINKPTVTRLNKNTVTYDIPALSLTGWWACLFLFSLGGFITLKRRKQLTNSVQNF